MAAADAAGRYRGVKQAPIEEPDSDTPTKPYRPPRNHEQEWYALRGDGQKELVGSLARR